MAGHFLGSGLTVGDGLCIDPRLLPELVIISKEDADKIAAQGPSREFVVTAVASAPRK